ncbi:MAG: ABC transporter ATP-binding protein [Deltaproteobacteria bacterium]|nr:ABC transporter ATP-binding protein [Deltaproteobacteria bacterium]
MLKIRDLQVDYGGIKALKKVCMDIHKGEIVTLIGANGAGKTTTLRTVSGLKKPFKGEIWFNDMRIDGLSPQRIVKLGIGHVPEGRHVFKNLTVLENLKTGCYLRRDKEGIKRDMEGVFEHFPRLRERIRQKAESLSGGEQQMLAIARALMAGPTMLLLDEPSLGLAPVLVWEVGEIVAGINKRGVTAILVEQNAQMALSVAGRGYVLQSGGIVLEGTSEDLVKGESVKKAYLGG